MIDLKLIVFYFVRCINFNKNKILGKNQIFLYFVIENVFWFSFVECILKNYLLFFLYMSRFFYGKMREIEI